MGKSILGTQICSLRKNKGITQEELGREIGVTAQAVSNWECGGTPDAELLPRIATYFGVSIDHLFGKEDETKGNLEQELLWELYHTEKEKRFEKAYQYCWYIHQGLYNLDPNVLLNTMKEKIVMPNDTKFTSTLLLEEGISFMQLNEDNHKFYLLPTPEGGFKSKLLEAERYEEFFKILGKKRRIETLFFLYSRKNLALSDDRLAKHLSMKTEEAKDILDDLCGVNLVEKVEMETDGGECQLYKCCDNFMNNVPIITFLSGAMDLIDKSPIGIWNTSQDMKSLL